METCTVLAKTAHYRTTSIRLVEAVRVLLQAFTLDLSTLDKAYYSFAATTPKFNVTSDLQLHMAVGWDMWHRGLAMQFKQHR